MSDRAGRRAGLLIPLFACPSSESWGIGDIGDLPTIARWLADAGQRVLQLLPLNEMAPGQQSPYSAISAMAIDPIFISLSRVPEFIALGGEDGARATKTARVLAHVRARAAGRVLGDSSAQAARLPERLRSVPRRSSGARTRRARAPSGRF